MLACVVGIPALAMSGTSWSEIVKKLQDFRWPAILTPASATSSASADEAGQQSAAARETSQASAAPAWQGQSAGQPSSGVIPAGYQAPADSQAPRAATGLTAGQNGVGTVPPGGDPFRTTQERLKQLGATYYLLESWGNQQQMYRFYCRMAIGGNPNYTHYFEAVESDPLQAMHRVLAQVESWHQGGTAASGR
jgi:hypothetical protein